MLSFRQRRTDGRELSRYEVYQQACEGDPGRRLGHVVRVHVGWVGGRHLSAWHGIDRDGKYLRSGSTRARFTTRDTAGQALLAAALSMPRRPLPRRLASRQTASPTTPADEKTAVGRLLSARHVAAPDPLERRAADGAGLFCCTSQQPHDQSTWRVLLRRMTSDSSLVPAEPDDACCPECGTPGQQVSHARQWTRA
jgi:hypothetical protein